VGFPYAKTETGEPALKALPQDVSSLFMHGEGVVSLLPVISSTIEMIFNYYLTFGSSFSCKFFT